MTRAHPHGRVSINPRTGPRRCRAAPETASWRGRPGDPNVARGQSNGCVPLLHPRERRYHNAATVSVALAYGAAVRAAGSSDPMCRARPPALRIRGGRCVMTDELPPMRAKGSSTRSPAPQSMRVVP